jgi:hypothetical protein
LVFNSNNDPAAPPGPEPGNAATATPAAPADAAATPPAVEAPSPAVARFNSCRWQQPAEEGNAAFCTHREVKPYAGTTGFDAEAWCAECQYYKLRRVPKKRQPSDEYTY